LVSVLVKTPIPKAIIANQLHMKLAGPQEGMTEKEKSQDPQDKDPATEISFYQHHLLGCLPSQEQLGIWHQVAGTRTPVYCADRPER
jgi:hypothetical protein